MVEDAVPFPKIFQQLFYNSESQDLDCSCSAMHRSWIAKIEQMIYHIVRFAQRRPDMNGEDQGLDTQEIRGLYRGKGDLHEE